MGHSYLDSRGACSKMKKNVKPWKCKTCWSNHNVLTSNSKCPSTAWRCWLSTLHHHLCISCTAIAFHFKLIMCNSHFMHDCTYVTLFPGFCLMFTTKFRLCMCQTHWSRATVQLDIDGYSYTYLWNYIAFSKDTNHFLFTYMQVSFV